MILPKPCNCVIQNVDDNKPPVIEHGVNNSIIQTVSINTPKGKLVEWFLTILLTVFFAAVLIGGCFFVAKSTTKNYLSFVQETIQTMEPAKLVNITNSTPLTNQPSYTNIIVKDTKWRMVSSDDGDFVEIDYSLINTTMVKVTEIRFDIKINDAIVSFKDIDFHGETSILPAESKRDSTIFIPVSKGNAVTNLVIKGNIARAMIP